MKKIIIGVMIVISFVFVLKISCVQAQNIMGDETSQEENCEQLNWTLENGILIISGQGKIPMDFFEDNSIDPDQPKELIIKRGITEIEPDAFRECNSLKKVTLPDGLETIGPRAFQECQNLDYIEIPDTVTYLGREAFLLCSKLKYVKLSKGLKSISGAAFENCASLESICIPEGVETIDWYAFNFCRRLKMIMIPNSLKDISPMVSYEFPVKLVAMDDNPVIEEAVKRFPELSYVRKKDYICNHRNNDYSIETATKDKDGKAIFICERCGETSIGILPRVQKAVMKKQTFRYQKGEEQHPWIDIIKNDGTKLAKRYYQITYPKNSMYPGTYQATVKLKNGYEGSMNVEYTILKAQQYLHRNSNKMITKSWDEPFYVNLNKFPSNCKFQWKSSDPKIASVDMQGKIIGKKRGTCKIYVYAKEDEHYERSATVSIKVKIVSGKIKKIHLKRISGKQLKVTWKKDTRYDGYWVDYGTKKNMLDSRRLTINNSNKNRIYLKNLKHKKKYYVIVRGYKKIKKGKRYIPEFSPVNKLTITI